MKNKNVTIEKHSGEEEKSPKIIVRCVGHEFFYPISDILRLFTGEIPRQEETCVVCDAGAMASCSAVFRRTGSRLIRKRERREKNPGAYLSIRKI